MSSAAALQRTPVEQTLRTEAFQWYLDHGIHTDDELQLFIEEYFGYRITKEAVCPEHTSPLSFVADQFFERVQTALGFANRGGGKTINVAMLNVLDAIFKPGVEIASAGAIMQQADKGYEYLRHFCFDDPLFLNLLVSSLKQETVFANGSIVRIIAGTYHGMNSPHPNKFRLDEIELLHWTLLQEGLQMSIEKGGYKAQDTLTSTRKFQRGTMQRLLDESKQKKVKVYSWCIFEVLEHCTRQCHGDPKWGDCPAYSLVDSDGQEQPMCAGIAHRCNGWYKIEDFVKKVKVLDLDTWNTQWRNLKPSSSVLVYGDFFRDQEPWVCEPFRIPDNWTVISGTDFGTHFAYHKFAHDPVQDTWYCFWEYYHVGERTLEAHYSYMSQSPLFTRKEWAYCDPSGKQAILDLNNISRKHGGPLFEPANNDVYGGVNLLKTMFTRRAAGKTPKLVIFKYCAQLIKELSTLYRYKMNKDGTVDRDTVVKQDDHCVDDMRYAFYSYTTLAKASVKPKKVKNLS